MDVVGTDINVWSGLTVDTYPGMDRVSHLRSAMERMLALFGARVKDGTPVDPVLRITTHCCKRQVVYQYISNIPLITTPCPCGAKDHFLVRWNEGWEPNKIPIDSPSRTDYQVAEVLGRTRISRWENGVPHHPQSRRLMKFLEEHDLKDCGDSFNWKTGGDGDNGEALMYEMDSYFETLDLLDGNREDVQCLPQWPDSVESKIEEKRIWILEYRENPANVVVIAPATSLEAVKAIIRTSKGDFDKGYFAVYSQVVDDYDDMDISMDFYDLDGNLLKEQPV